MADVTIERDSSSVQGVLASLSAGQCEVLDLLLAGYETNKEIAHELGIAPSTVAQRIVGAANKLRTNGRGATKREYGRLRQACAFPVYPPQHIPISEDIPQQPLWDWSAPSALNLHDAMRIDRFAPWADRVERPTGLEALIEKLNAASATTIIMGQAVLLIILAIAVLATMGIFFEFDFLRFVI